MRWATWEAKIPSKEQQVRHRTCGRSVPILSGSWRSSQIALDACMGQSKWSLYTGTRLLTGTPYTTQPYIPSGHQVGAEGQAPVTVSGLRRATDFVPRPTPTPHHLGSSPDSTDKTPVDCQAQTPSSHCRHPNSGGQITSQIPP